MYIFNYSMNIRKLRRNIFVELIYPGRSRDDNTVPHDSTSTMILRWRRAFRVVGIGFRGGKTSQSKHVVTRHDTS